MSSIDNDHSKNEYYTNEHTIVSEAEMPSKVLSSSLSLHFQESRKNDEKIKIAWRNINYSILTKSNNIKFKIVRYNHNSCTNR